MFDREDCYGALLLYRSIESAKKNTNKMVMDPRAQGQWGGTNETFLGNILELIPATPEKPTNQQLLSNISCKFKVYL